MTPLDGDFVFTGEASGEGVAGLRVDDGSVNVISIEIDEVVRGSQLEVGDVFEVTSHGGSGCFADWENFVDGERYLVGVGPIGTNSQRLTYSTDWSGRFTRMGFVVGGAIVLFALLQMSDRSPRPRRDEVVIRRGEVQSQDPSKRNASR